MIAGSRLWRVGALAAAVLIHAAIGWALMADIEIEMEGSSGAEEARIGTSFADMAAGTLKATETEDTTESIEPDMAEPVAEPVQNIAAEPVELEPVQPSEALTPTETPRSVPELAEDAVPTIAALTPETLAEPTPSPQQAETVTAEPAEEALEADEEEAVSRSLRPKRRSEEFEKKNEQIAKQAAPEPKPEPKKQSQPKKQPRGNAEQNNLAGAATGNASAEATTSGTAGSSDATSGNAAASNYPGKVMQRLSRARRPKVGSRGTVAVAFSISDGGGLSAVSVASSSGSAALDRAAVQMIRGAAPFPAPPPGAQRSFSIRIEGR